MRKENLDQIITVTLRTAIGRRRGNSTLALNTVQYGKIGFGQNEE